MPALKIPDGLTIKMTTNVREKTTKVVAYRKGRFKYAYKATLPMCDGGGSCPGLRGGPHTEVRFARGGQRNSWSVYTKYHASDIDKFMKELIKTYR